MNIPFYAAAAVSFLWFLINKHVPQDCLFLPVTSLGIAALGLVS